MLCTRHGNEICSDPECDPRGVMHAEVVQTETWGMHPWDEFGPYCEHDTDRSAPLLACRICDEDEGTTTKFVHAFMLGGGRTFTLTFGVLVDLDSSENEVREFAKAEIRRLIPKCNGCPRCGPTGTSGGADILSFEVKDTL